jgi:integrase/recombinase XerD
MNKPKLPATRPGGLPAVRVEHDDAAVLPAIVEAAGGNARFAYEEFLAGIDSPNTLRAYRHALHRFLEHVDGLGLGLQQVTPKLVSAYLRQLKAKVRVKQDEPARFEEASKPMKKLHLAALRHFFDKAVERHAVMLNPALSVRGPKHSVREGKTKGLGVKQARQLLESIDVSTAVGLRDRAVIASLIYTAARRGALAKMKRGDFHTDGRQHYFQLDEKGGKQRTIPCREDLERFMDAYFAAVGPMDKGSWLFRTMQGRTNKFTEKAMTGDDILAMFKRRLKDAGLPEGFSCHSCRKATATNLLEQGVELADVQHFLGHADPRTTKLYDQRQLSVTRNIVERIGI